MHRCLIALLTGLGLALAAPTQEKPAALKPINLEGVNTAADEDDPHLSSSGLQLYYASNSKGKFDIMVTARSAPNQLWPAGKLLEDYVQTTVDDRSVFATTDGRHPQYLYFATKKDKRVNNFDLYVAVKQIPGAAFTAPTPLNTLCSEAEELHPWLSADGREIHFSRYSDQDGWRVYVARRASATGGGGFSAPEMIKELPEDFHHATLTPDGRTMYLQGLVGKGRSGIFRSTRTASGWGKPVPLEALNNAEGEAGDRSPCLSRDGALLYFASDRPGGKGGLDLYVVRVSDLK